MAKNNLPQLEQKTGQDGRREERRGEGRGQSRTQTGGALVLWCSEWANLTERIHWRCNHAFLAKFIILINLIRRSVRDLKLVPSVTMSTHSPTDRLAVG